MSYILRPYQTDAVAKGVAFLRSNTSGGGLVVLPTGCLTGDTIVFTNRAGNGHRQTLETIYHAQVQYASRRKATVIPFTRSFSGSRIGLHPFQSVVYSGIQPTFELELVDGCLLRGTATHPILTPAGFMPLADLCACHHVICDAGLNFGQGVPREVAVKRVSPTGRDEAVYDLVACSPYRNFVANGIVVHNSGKSLVIAGIAHQLGAPCLIFQPSKEILEQNATKLLSYGIEPAVFSASFDSKNIGSITLATIGSVRERPDLFDSFPYVMVDEAHQVSSKESMYKNFLEALGDVRILGLTATPYRLSVDGYGGAILKFLTRTRPRIFEQVVAHAQIHDLIEQGYLHRPEYQVVSGFSRGALQLNSTGADYTDESVKRYFNRIGFHDRLRRVVLRLLEIGRRNVLVFTRFVDEAMDLVSTVPGTAVLTSDTTKSMREKIVMGFRRGDIQVVANVGVLGLGFDFPELETIVCARPTNSLAVYYQQVGRLLRPHPDKESAWVVDMVDHVGYFGKIEDLWLRAEGKRGTSWEMALRLPNGKFRPLTNAYFGNEGFRRKVRFGKKLRMQR